MMLQPPYRSLFSEFVSVPPLLVMVMLHSATPVIAGLTPALLLVEAVLRRRTERYLVALCVVALIAAAGLVIAFVAAIYLPIIRLSGELD